MPNPEHSAAVVSIGHQTYIWGVLYHQNVYHIFDKDMYIIREDLRWNSLNGPSSYGRVDCSATVLPDGRIIYLGGWSTYYKIFLNKV